MQKQMKEKYRYYTEYTGIFSMLAIMIYFVFFRQQKSFVYALYGDGHVCFNSLVYYGRWLRQIVVNIIENHQFRIPLWDISIGYGSDIITTFNWMTLGDPLNLLAVFFPADNMEYLYGFLAIFRIYLAGVSFSIFARYQKNENLPVLAGSIIYAFCGFALFAGVRDVYFMSPMIYFPLLCIGVDKIYTEKKAVFFTCMIALAGITNFYYFYMLSIWIFIYGIYRYVMIFQNEGMKLKKISRWLFRCISSYLIGVALAAVILLPIIYQLTGSERFANKGYVPMLYSFDYYWKIIVRFITTESMEAWTHLGFAPMCLLALWVLLLKKNRIYRPYKSGFIMCMIFLALPIAGSLMNAGSYVVNRWIWAFSFLVAYIFVKIWPELFQLTRQDKIIIVGMTVLYVSVCMLRTEYRTNQLLIMLVILLLSVLAVLAGDYLVTYKKIRKWLIFGCVIIGVAANGVLRYSASGSNYVAGFVDTGKAWSSIHDDLPSRSIEKLSDSRKVRYDSIGIIEPMYNTAMNHNINGTNFYFSLANGTITRFFDALNVNVEMEHRYKGVDERTILERLAGVKYCISGKDSLEFVPYGYNKIVSETAEYVLFENENALSLGYTYDSYYPLDEYERLSAVRKQEVLIQSAVVDSEKVSVDLSKADPVFSEREIPFEIVSEEGIVIQEDEIIVDNTDKILKLIITAEPNSEIYLQLKGIRYEGRGEGAAGQSGISYIRESSTKHQVLYSAEHPFYHGRDDYLINMGYNENDNHMEVKISFDKKGVYYLEDLKVVAQPMELVDKQTAAHSDEMLENIQIDTNKISGNIEVEKKKVLNIAIPYSQGWTAYIDGKKVETFCVNQMYLGILVPAGEHEMVLVYLTPGLRLGVILGGAGLMCLLLMVIKGKRRRS